MENQIFSRHLYQKAIDLSKKCKNEKEYNVSPKVGALLVLNGKSLPKLLEGKIKKFLRI